MRLLDPLIIAMVCGASAPAIADSGTGLDASDDAVVAEYIKTLQADRAETARMKNHRWANIRGRKLASVAPEIIQQEPRMAVIIGLRQLQIITGAKPDTDLEIYRSRPLHKEGTEVWFRQKINDIPVHSLSRIRFDRKGNVTWIDSRLFDADAVSYVVVARGAADSIVREFVPIELQAPQAEVYFDAFEHTSVRLYYDDDLSPFWYYSNVIVEKGDPQTFTTLNVRVSATTGEASVYSDALFFSSVVCTPDTSAADSLTPQNNLRVKSFDRNALSLRISCSIRSANHYAVGGRC